MPPRPETRLTRLRDGLTTSLAGPQMLAFLPALALAAYWIGGEPALILASLGAPLVYAAGRGFTRSGVPLAACDAVTGLALRDRLEQALDHALQIQASSTRKTACFMVQLDDPDVISDRHGRATSENLQLRIADRLRGVLREGDLVCKTGEFGYGIGLAPVSHLDLEVAIQLSARIQAAVEEPVSVDGTVMYVSCSVGFCLGSRSPLPTGEALSRAATVALAEAARNAPSAIRAYTPDMPISDLGGGELSEDLETAFDQGQIVAHFQPQVSTDTGQIAGFEALARWHHPERGIIPPADFLPALVRSRQMERLTDLMLVQALIALRRWDEEGLDIPQIGVNFSGIELHNPQLVDKIAWQLDRYGIAPERLAVEILETVVATSPDDAVTRNVNGLTELGCRIDLDDFGTGHASISSIRRFAIQRLKIDRSFVMKVDRDKEQQDMVAAILTMAERLGLDTLAEGVETPGEHTMLAQLGCSHVQGFGIARPMPYHETLAWVREYRNSIGATPEIGRRTG